MDNIYQYKGFSVSASARQINDPPNEAWGPLYRINGKDQSQAWTPRDRSVVFKTERTAIAEAVKRAQWVIDNSAPTLRSTE
jgi:hypothetical protein